jgi:predicted CoA-binding protein
VRTPEQILREARTIAIVGASPREGRPSHTVMRYLQRAGFRCLPVNPTCDKVLGMRAVARLAELEEPVDLVDVFRRSEYCAGVAHDSAAIGAPALWLQLGIFSDEARRVAEDAGMDYVENACTAVVHRFL